MIKRGSPDLFDDSVTKPDDFDAFWEAVQGELDELPLDPHLRHIPERSTPEVDVFELHYTSLHGVRIAAWYCRPTTGYLDGPYPGLAVFPGYVSEPTLPKSWAKQGYAAIGVAPRGKLRSNAQFNPGYPGLLVHRLTDPNTYSYRAFYADALRAVDVLLELPEVDSSRIGLTGGSQGGALTLVAAALRRDVVTCGALAAPYLTGFMESAALTRSYPYEEINEYLRLYPDDRDQVRETTRYFDCLNFAPMITAPLLLHIGLMDDICPPETAYALARRLECDLTFHQFAGCGHEAGRYWETPVLEAYLAERLKPGAWSREDLASANATF